MKALSLYWAESFDDGERDYKLRLTFYRGATRTWSIYKNYDGPSCGDSLDTKEHNGSGTWVAAAPSVGIVRLTADKYEASSMISTYSDPTPVPTSSRGEFPEHLALAALAPGGNGVPCVCFERNAILRVDDSAQAAADVLAAFFGE